MNKLLLFLLFFLFIAPIILYSLPPVFILGISGGTEAASENQEPVSADFITGADASLGWRGYLFEKGYISIAAGFSGKIVNLGTFQDQENLLIKASLPGGPGRINLESGLLSSITGTSLSSPFVNPQWGIGFSLDFGNGDISGAAEYSGYSLVEPDDTGDIFYEGGKITVSYSPSIRYEIALSGGAGWENWYENALYTDAGGTAGGNRQDWVLDGKLTSRGLLGYFTEWNVPVRFIWRNSNANGFLEPDQFIPDTESRINFSVSPELSLSPHRSISIETGAYADFGRYLERKAFNSAGVVTDTHLFVNSLGGNFAFDWTRNNTFFVLLSGQGGYAFSNDPFETGWFFGASGGIQVSF